MNSNYEFVANQIMPYSQSFDLASNGESIAYAYIKDTVSIIRIFDIKLRLIID